MSRSALACRCAVLALSLTAWAGRAVSADGPVAEGGEAGFVTPGIMGEPPRPTFVPPESVLPPVAPPTFARSDWGDPAGLPSWHLLPGGVLFRSFIAGDREPRMGGELVHDDRFGTLLEGALGSRVSLVRYGTVGPDAEGFEVQVAGGAFLRQSLDREMDVEATDYRIGVPLVYRRGPTAFRVGYDHISSHVGDEFLLKNPDFRRINYVRDSILFAVAQNVTADVLVYGEVGYAFYRDGGAEPWEFQFGAEYAPPPEPGFRGAPVAAVNTHLRQEFDFDGNLSAVAGWQWRGMTADDLLRLGLTYYTGNSRQYSFLEHNETLFGVGLWYDF